MFPSPCFLLSLVLEVLRFLFYFILLIKNFFFATAVHSLKLSRNHVDWHSVDEVYLYSDATTSKIARTVSQKLGFSKGNWSFVCIIKTSLLNILYVSVKNVKTDLVYFLKCT